MKFLADDMVGKLARLLRLAGYDTEYVSGVEDSVVVAKAGAEGRTLLTRDRKIPKEWHINNVLVIDSPDPRAQFAQVVRTLKLDLDAQAFTRCLLCNGVLETVRKEDHRDAIPPYVYQTKDEFHRCTGCGKLYWMGTHYERLRKILDSVRT